MEAPSKIAPESVLLLPALETSAFRPEIAALRALAVMSVVLFHLKIEGFKGGFVGVDVFFVISGYLISRIILTDLEAKRFSFAQFYIRRMRRIFPALIFTVVITYIAGALWCSPLMFLDLAKESTHALLSIANIQYWRESHQYFAPNSDELALLHCWSLSAEEQFYLAWPLFLVIAYRIGRVREAVALASILSFVASIWVGRSESSATFFLTPFRTFEFGCGVLVLFVHDIRMANATREVLSAVGILTIVASVLAFRSDMPNLEAAMLVPCLGAAATILAGGKTRTAQLLTRPFVLWIGAISYSLYLCHWPIIFFARFIFGDDADGWLAKILMLAAMFVVAAFMYRFIERRFIQPSEFRAASLPKNAAVFCSIVLPLVAITHTTFVTKGFTWRVTEDQEKLAHLQDFPSFRDIEPVDGPLTFQLVGDSHAIQYLAGLSPLMKRMNIRMNAMGGPGCPILDGLVLKARRRNECIAARDDTLRRIGQDKLPMILALKWMYYDDATVDYQYFDPESPRSDAKGSYGKLEQALRRTLREFVAGGRHILLIGAQVNSSCAINRPRLLPGPLPHAPLKPCPPSTRESAEEATAALNAMLARVIGEWPDRVTLLRPVDYLCDSVCPVVSDGLWLYRDFDHFTVAGSLYMVKHAEAPFMQFLKSTLPQ
jgi:peptidoglycan/LPS O-acetylase OafA/YrhL